MPKKDTFEIDYKNAIDLYDTITEQLKERERQKLKNLNTAKIDYLITASLDAVKYEATNLDKLAYFYINEPDKFDISDKEIKKRQRKVEKFIELKDGIEKDI